MWDGFVNAFSGFGGIAHSELVFDNGESFTSSSRFDPLDAIYPNPVFCRAVGRTGGPVIRHIEMPDHLWKFTELPLVTDEQKLHCYQWAKQTIDQSIKDNAGYDWRGVMRFVFKCIKQHPEDWFCTESVVANLQENVGMFQGLDAWSLSPNKLYKLCR